MAGCVNRIVFLGWYWNDAGILASGADSNSIVGCTAIDFQGFRGYIKPNMSRRTTHIYSILRSTHHYTLTPWMQLEQGVLSTVIVISKLESKQFMPDRPGK